MARYWDGNNDLLKVDVGSADRDWGDTTMVFILRRASGGEDNVICGHDNGDIGQLDMHFVAGDELALWAAAETKSTFTVTAANGWVVIAASKATGNDAGRFHRYLYSTDTWTHENGDAAVADGANPGAGGEWWFSHWEEWNPYHGDMLVAAIYDRELSDDEVENLAFSLQNWYASAPVALWLFDQSAVTQGVIDATGGGADQSARVGTSVSTNHPPVFNRYGDILAAIAVAAVVADAFEAARQFGGLQPQFILPEIVAY